MANPQRTPDSLIFEVATSRSPLFRWNTGQEEAFTAHALSNRLALDKFEKIPQLLQRVGLDGFEGTGIRNAEGEGVYGMILRKVKTKIEAKRKELGMNNNTFKSPHAPHRRGGRAPRSQPGSHSRAGPWFHRPSRLYQQNGHTYPSSPTRAPVSLFIRPPSGSIQSPGYSGNLFTPGIIHSPGPSAPQSTPTDTVRPGPSVTTRHNINIIDLDDESDVEIKVEPDSDDEA
ncbi:hypothetical protein F5Y09DRAFT_354064 [Xylaria sp. FL1042]|nr:hypothetical protein F5Y09DRAFT_354064 [Xylaria sp. FL1042]